MDLCAQQDAISAAQPNGWKREEKSLNCQQHFVKHTHPTSKIPFSCFHINTPVNKIITVKDNAAQMPHATSTTP